MSSQTITHLLHKWGGRCDETSKSVEDKGYPMKKEIQPQYGVNNLNNLCGEGLVNINYLYGMNFCKNCCMYNKHYHTA
jgi:hypothetical protein